MQDHLDPTDLVRLSAWLGAGVELVQQLSGGSSNVTWLVRLGGLQAVLRHPPRARLLLPTAHDVLREATVLRALGSSTIPVPAVLATCDDLSVLGVPFVLTEQRPGVCLLTTALDGLDARGLAHHAIDTLADIHAIDVATVGIIERDGSYLARQIDRWQRQLARTSTATRLGDLEPIVHWLHAHRPVDEARTLIHGDYGFHNLLVSTHRIEAVLDWELCTFGDPVADVYSFLKSWGPGAVAPNDANDIVANAEGAPRRTELLARYASRSGRDIGRHERFYEMFGLWRSIGMFEGIHARSGAARFADETPQLVARAQGMMAAAPDPR